MCGISGKIYLNSQKIDLKDIESMNTAIIHRGPDDHGIYISENGQVGFGNQRLSVIDLSSKGHMPMVYKNKYVITYNGEIYNFQDQKKLLKKEGYSFYSNTDTEVILALYDKYNTDCLKYLRGMFSFAIYDKVKNIVFMARDRLGKKPFKFYFERNVFIFASELKAILTQKEVKKEVDFEAIFDYLTFGYTIAPQTGFAEINKLEPGHYLLLNLYDKSLQNVRYWSPDYSEKLNLSEADWQKSIMHKLNESVKLRMVSDVPIGAFLSGGVDSSTVVALMAKNSNKPINTFTVSFKDKNLDESGYADTISKLYKTNHQTLLAKPNNVEILPELAKMYEEPFADASNVVTYLISKLAKEYVTVILNGDGGDENFVGYERYYRVQRDFLYDKYLSFSKYPLYFSSNLLLKIFKANHYLNRINRFLIKSRLPFSDRYCSYIEYFSQNQKEHLYKRLGNEFTPSSQKILKSFRESNTVEVRDKALYFDMTRYLPDDLLAKVDIASMGVSLEARSPFLDQELVELTCKIPFSLKFKDGNYKHILKGAIKDLVPDENVNRRKIGFTIPLDQWFEGSLNSYAKSVLLKKNSFTLSMFKKEFINNMLQKHNKSNDFGPKLWALLSLELWHKAYFS